MKQLAASFFAAMVTLSACSQPGLAERDRYDPERVYLDEAVWVEEG